MLSPTVRWIEFAGVGLPASAEAAAVETGGSLVGGVESEDAPDEQADRTTAATQREAAVKTAGRVRGRL